MMKKSELKKLKEYFDYYYDLIYTAEENGQTISGYKEALKHFDHLEPAESIILNYFVQYRHDYISSDREVVAFLFSVNKFYNAEILKK